MDSSKRFKLSFAILSVGYILLGLLRLLAPGQSDDLTCYLLGVLAIITGIIRITFYFIKDDPARAFRNDLAVGIILAVAGVYIIARASTVAVLLPVLLGFCIVFDSIIKLQNSFDLRRTGFAAWWVVLVVAVVTGILGGLLILGIMEGTMLHYYFGIVLLVDGLANLAVLVLMTLQLKKMAQAAQTQPSQPPPPPPLPQ